MRKKIAVIGGGASGVFAAIEIKKCLPNIEVVVFESSKELLCKLKVSGGGRCNVTHHQFDAKQLVQSYPRGYKELVGPFSRFAPQDTIAWFRERGVDLHVEEDGRMFPTTNSSQTIIDCLVNRALELGVHFRLSSPVVKITGHFLLETASAQEAFDGVILASGSHPSGYRLAKSFGHTIIDPIPSLFTFNVPSSPLLHLSGLSVPAACIGIVGSKWIQKGPILLTHWGMSGPAVIKLSAWAASELYVKDYRQKFWIDWTGGMGAQSLLHEKKHSTLTIKNLKFAQIPARLWQELIILAGIDPEKRISHISDKQLGALIRLLERHEFEMEGQSKNKEEFVTCGGVSTKEVDFKTMESKLVKGLYFTGEILNIDGITGGFNFQFAWTSSILAARGIALKADTY